MKTTEKDRLLSDLLRDESYATFRANLFVGLLGDLRRKQARRTRRKLLAVAACVPIAFGIFLLMSSQTRRSVQQLSTVSIVRTVPLLADCIVKTSGNTESAITPRELTLVVTSHSEIEIVRSTGNPTESLSDEQLLDLFKGRPVALVSVGPTERRLVLLDEEQH